MLGRYACDQAGEYVRPALDDEAERAWLDAGEDPDGRCWPAFVAINHSALGLC